MVLSRSERLVLLLLTAAILMVSGAAGYTWTEAVLNETIVYGADIGYAPSGTLQVAYSNQMTDLRIAGNTGSGWTQVTIDNDTASRAVSLDYAPDGTTGIAYFGPLVGGTSARYAWNTGSGWQTEKVNFVYVAYNPVSLAYDGTSVPWVAAGISNGLPQVGERTGAASWDTAKVDPTGTGTTYSAVSIARVSGDLAVAYCGESALKYATESGGVWTNITVDASSADTGQYASLAVNPVSGSPGIAYCDVTAEAIRYAWYDGGWHTETVASGGDLCSGGTALAFSSTGMPAILYLDRTNQRMMYAEKDVTWSTEQVAGPPDTFSGEYLDYVQYSLSLVFSPADVPIATYYRGDFVVATDGPLETGSISVSSSPAGAAISLDGDSTGEVTPATLENVPVGVHNVSVGLAGYGTEYDPAVTVTTDATTPVSFTLTPVPPGSLTVTSTPSGAAISLDGSATGQVTPYTFADLPAGPHTVNVTLNGYYPDEDTVNVASGTTTPISFTLTPLPAGNIYVTTSPVQGAAIYLDSSPTGRVTNSTLTGLTPGTYTVEVRLSGWETGINSSVVVADGETTDVAFVLVERPFDWNIEVVDDGGAEGHQFPGSTSLALSGGLATIGYYDETDRSLRAVRQSESGWTRYEVDGNSSWSVTAGEFSFLSTAIDPATGLPAIAYSYTDTTNGIYQLRYATFNGSGWEIEVADDQGYGIYTGATPSLAFLGDSSPVIAYCLMSNPEYAMAATRNATAWSTILFDVQTPGGYAATRLQHESVAVDASGTACISIGDSDGVYFIRYVPGETPDIQCIEQIQSFDSSIAVAPDGTIGIAYPRYLGYKMNISYAWSTDSGVTWNIETAVSADDEPNISGLVSLAFDSDSNPAIAYPQATVPGDADLRFGWRDNGVWKTCAVDTGYNTGLYPSMQFSGTSPAISYINYSSRDLMYASVPAETTSERVLSSGWSMYSVPVSSPVMTVPGQVSPTAYRYDPVFGGYASVSPAAVQPGTGYWFSASGPCTVIAEGVPLTEESFPLSAGWNMIGCVNGPVAVSSLVTVPAGAIQSTVYDYTGGSYSAVTTMQPGHGYWVAATSDCTLTMTA